MATLPVVVGTSFTLSNSWFENRFVGGSNPYRWSITFRPHYGGFPTTVGTQNNPNGWGVTLVSGEYGKATAVVEVVPPSGVQMSSAGYYTFYSFPPNNFGTTGKWRHEIDFAFVVKPKLPPVAVITGDVNGCEAELSGASSYDTDGYIVSYRWDFGDGETADGAVVEHHWEVDGQYTVTLTVTDNDGLSDSEQRIIHTECGVRFGSILDATGVLFSAVNDGDNVQIYRFPDGIASRQSLAVIENAKNPSYAYDKRKNRHYVSYEDRSDGAQKMVYSLSSGREFLS